VADVPSGLSLTPPRETKKKGLDVLVIFRRNPFIVSASSLSLGAGEAGRQMYTRWSLFFRHSLHFRHHAYHTDRSVETAFHNLVYKIDRALEDGLVLLATFLDIEVVFDIITFESVCKAAEEQVW
jgi:hypothetical protein